MGGMSRGDVTVGNAWYTVTKYPPSLYPATRFWVNPTMRKGLMLKFSPYGWDSFGEVTAV